MPPSLNNTSWFSVDPDDIETNIVFFKVRNHAALEAVEKLKDHHILVSATSQDTIRAVTHLDITDDGLAKTQDVLARHFRDSVPV